MAANGTHNLSVITVHSVGAEMGVTILNVVLNVTFRQFELRSCERLCL